MSWTRRRGVRRGLARRGFEMTEELSRTVALHQQHISAVSIPPETIKRILSEMPASIPAPKDTIRPSHYKQGGIECWDALKAHLNQDEFIGFLRGNIAKYEWRLREKGNALEDARKMRVYQDKLIETLAEISSQSEK